MNENDQYRTNSVESLFSQMLSKKTMNSADRQTSGNRQVSMGSAISSVLIGGMNQETVSNQESEYRRESTLKLTSNNLYMN